VVKPVGIVVKLGGKIKPSHTPKLGKIKTGKKGKTTYTQMI